MKEKSLVIFTVFGQMAVGAFLALFILRLILINNLEVGASYWLDSKLLLGIGLAVALSLLASFFHLGSPQRAYRALTNLRTSWLSREILFTLAFAVTGGVYAALEWSQADAEPWQTGMSWLIIVSGLTMVYCMARVYRLRTAPVWNKAFTPLSFYLTALLTGGLLVGCILPWTPNYSGSINQDYLIWGYLHWLAFSAGAWIGIEILIIFLGSTPLERKLWIRLALLLLSAGCMVVFLEQPFLFQGQAAVYFLLAFVLVLASELFGRVMFYQLREQDSL